MAGRWRFVLTDMNYNPVGEILNAKERKIAFVLSSIDTLSFKVRLDNQLADALATTGGYIKAYRDNIPQFFGPIISAEEVYNKDSQSVSVNAAGVGWYMQKRYAGKNASGDGFGLTDRSYIAASLINVANWDSNMGIDPNTLNISSGSAVTYRAGPYKTVLECVKELGNTFDGFDWRILAKEPDANGYIGTFFAAPLIGVQQDNAIFECGDGRNNIMEYKRTVSRDTQANKVYHNVNAGPDAPGYPTISALDAASITDWKLVEDLVAADLLDSTMRTQLVQEHVQVRKSPREIITFTPHIDPQRTGRLPDYYTDYNLGDRVRARAVYKDVVRFDVWPRVYGVQFELDDSNGLERQTLTLTEEI